MHSFSTLVSGAMLQLLQVSRVFCFNDLALSMSVSRTCMHQSTNLAWTFNRHVLSPCMYQDVLDGTWLSSVPGAPYAKPQVMNSSKEMAPEWSLVGCHWCHIAQSVCNKTKEKEPRDVWWFCLPLVTIHWFRIICGWRFTGHVDTRWYKHITTPPWPWVDQILNQRRA